MSDFKEWLDGLECEFVRVKQVRQKFNEANLVESQFTKQRSEDIKKPIKQLTGEELLKSDFEEWANNAIDMVNGLKEIAPQLMEVNRLVHNISEEKENDFKTEVHTTKMSNGIIQKEIGITPTTILKNERNFTNYTFETQRNIFKNGYDAGCHQLPELMSFGITREKAIANIKEMVENHIKVKVEK
jgi:predicted RNase H-like HicB family nuclease